MGKSKKKQRARSPEGAPVGKLPKKKCCESKTRCGRCPLRMLKEGSLPPGYTVHKRKLVTLEKASRLQAATQAKKAAKAA